ncbi:unnamed protein product [Pleuronectes platessa]|uniref:Uncharacterized protein n=1 Tax=Pleuronectes platessa TaxID=8262 RepID=A0A9N7V4L2_PLEPL|nr:unnamed protein product [Pleuronectes platessa]
MVLVLGQHEHRVSECAPAWWVAQRIGTMERDGYKWTEQPKLDNLNIFGVFMTTEGYHGLPFMLESQRPPADTQNRKQSSTQKAKGAASSTYSDAFRVPSCGKTFVSTTTERRRYHTLNSTKYFPISTYKNISIHRKRIKVPPKAPKPCLLQERPETSSLSKAPETSLQSEAPETSLPPEALEPSLPPMAPNRSEGLTTYRATFVAHPRQAMERPYTFI